MAADPDGEGNLGTSAGLPHEYLQALTRPAGIGEFLCVEKNQIMAYG